VFLFASLFAICVGIVKRVGNAALFF